MWFPVCQPWLVSTSENFTHHGPQSHLFQRDQSLSLGGKGSYKLVSSWDVLFHLDIVAAPMSALDRVLFTP